MPKRLLLGYWDNIWTHTAIHLCSSHPALMVCEDVINKSGRPYNFGGKPDFSCLIWGGPQGTSWPLGVQFWWVCKGWTEQGMSYVLLPQICSLPLWFQPAAELAWGCPGLRAPPLHRSRCRLFPELSVRHPSQALKFKLGDIKGNYMPTFLVWSRASPCARGMHLVIYFRLRENRFSFLYLL